MMNMMNGMFGKVANGMCRVSMDGNIAIKTSNGFKTYNVETGVLQNCDNFAFDIGSDFFFVIPTNKVEKGDIIFAANRPHCVLEVKDNMISAFNYESGTIVNLVPEHHMFMGHNYFYGKIVSMFGNLKGDKSMESMMKFMMMSQMMGNGNGKSDMNSMLPMMFMMNGGMDNMFSGMFDGMKEEK